jgi:hypothetical protein
VAEPRQLALIHAEIDGELNAEQRAELARYLLADPEVRAVRDDLRRLCTALEGLAPVEPPERLRESILAALPQPSRQQHHSFAPRWRYAAAIAGLLAVGVVAVMNLKGPQTATTDATGTMASVHTSTVLDTVRLDHGPVSGRVSLYRDPKGLSLEIELSANAPVDVLISSNGRLLRVNGLGNPDQPSGSRRTVALSGGGMDGQTVDLTFLMDGRQVGGVTLRASSGS